MGIEPTGRGERLRFSKLPPVRVLAAERVAVAAGRWRTGSRNHPRFGLPLETLSLADGRRRRGVGERPDLGGAASGCCGRSRGGARSRRAAGGPGLETTPVRVPDSRGGQVVVESIHRVAAVAADRSGQLRLKSPKVWGLCGGLTDCVPGCGPCRIAPAAHRSCRSGRTDPMAASMCPTAEQRRSGQLRCVWVGDEAG